MTLRFAVVITEKPIALTTFREIRGHAAKFFWEMTETYFAQYYDLRKVVDARKLVDLCTIEQKKKPLNAERR